MLEDFQALLRCLFLHGEDLYARFTALWPSTRSLSCSRVFQRFHPPEFGTRSSSSCVTTRAPISRKARNYQWPENSFLEEHRRPSRSGSFLFQTGFHLSAVLLSGLFRGILNGKIIIRPSRGIFIFFFFSKRTADPEN